MNSPVDPASLIIELKEARADAAQQRELACTALKQLADTTEAAEADNAKLRAEVERLNRTAFAIFDEGSKQKDRAIAAEAREAALVACLHDLEKAGANLAIPYEGLLADNESRRWIAPVLWAAIEEGVTAFRALLPAQPRQAAPDPSLTLIRKLTDALQEALAASDRQLMRVGFLTESKRLIARTTQYLREHGADSPEASGEERNYEKND